MTADSQPTPVPQVTADPGVQPEQEPAPPLKVDQAIAELRRFEEIDRAAVARGESPNWWERGSEPAASRRDAEDAVGRAAHRWYYEHGFTPGYLPRNILGSDRDLKLAVEALGGAA